MSRSDQHRDKRRRRRGNSNRPGKHGPRAAEPSTGAAVGGAIPGYGVTELEDWIGLVQPPEQEGALAETTQALLRFVAARDPVSLLARTGAQLIYEMTGKSDRTPDPTDMEQAEAELLQTIALTFGKSPAVPSTPRNMARVWALLRRNLLAFMHSAAPAGEPDPEQALAHRARVQTLYYRNIFNSDDAKIIVPDLLGRMDAVAEARLGYAMSDLYCALFAIFGTVGERFGRHHGRVADMIAGKRVPKHVAGMTAGSPMLQRVWRFAPAGVDPSGSAGAARQLSELAWAEVFTFRRADLVERFGEPVTAALFRLAIPPGALNAEDLSHYYLESPVRQRPFIAVDADTLFLPIPALIISFPFEMAEYLIGEDETLQKAYNKARGDYLEDAVASLLAETMPSARILRNIFWTDSETGRRYENDVAAILGNHIFLFEAKSGKIKPASRRGGAASLRKNLKQLFVEPGEQAARLQRLLARGPEAAELLERKDGRKLDLDLSTPKIVHTFGVAIEHLAALTSNRHHFEALGLIESEDPWSPILSLGEMRMLATHLDTELSFFHYLTRRATIETQISFNGDEQDLLAMYLTNGFAIDPDALEGRQVMFTMADGAVRGPREPRSDRRSFDTHGIRLSPYWRLVAKEIHDEGGRHKFDILETLLNQSPSALHGVEQRIRRFRSGGGGGQMMFVRSRIGERVFVLVMLPSKHGYENAEEWTNASRAAAYFGGDQAGATDCVVLLRVRRSPATTFDAISFFRIVSGNGPGGTP